MVSHYRAQPPANLTHAKMMLRNCWKYHRLCNHTTIAVDALKLHSRNGCVSSIQQPADRGTAGVSAPLLGSRDHQNLDTNNAAEFNRCANNVLWYRQNVIEVHRGARVKCQSVIMKVGIVPCNFWRSIILMPGRGSGYSSGHCCQPSYL